MKLTLRSEALSLILILATFAIAAAAWPTAPERIPVHWGVNAQPDRYGGKFEGLLAIPFLALGVYLLLILLPRIDPRREHYASFAGAYATLRTAIIALLAGTYLLVILWIQGQPVNISLVVPVLVGMLFIVLGNYMPKTRSNWFVGIRTPWTLSSEETWVKTHRFGGKLFVLIGIMLVAGGIMRPDWVALALLPVSLAVGALLWVYSYLVWKRDISHQGPGGSSVSGQKVRP